MGYEKVLVVNKSEEFILNTSNYNSDVFGKYSLLHDHNYLSDNQSMPYYKCAFVNVCGLYSKLKVPDFIEFVNKYDIVALAETKTGDYSNVDITGYSLFPQTDSLKDVKRRNTLNTTKYIVP